MLSRDTYLNLVTTHIKNKNLVKHCFAVEAAMKGIARHMGEDEELWSRVGLIHDADWEEMRDDFANHTKKTVEFLKQAGETDERIADAVLSHNYTRNGFRAPANNMEWALYTCDELTGLIVAIALVRPEKKLASVTVDSILKKFPQKAFAAGVDRQQIGLCEEKLHIPLPQFVEIVLASMQQEHEALGL